MVTLQVVNACKPPLADIAEEMLLRRLHAGPSAWKESGVVERSADQEGGRIGISAERGPSKYLWAVFPANRHFRFLPILYGTVIPISSRLSKN